MLVDIGFSVPPNQNAFFSAVNIKKFRAPSNSLLLDTPTAGQVYNGTFSNDLDRNPGFWIKVNAFYIEGGEAGNSIIANPSQNATPMLRASFSTEIKKIYRARIYTTARGIYELYLNGKRISEDYFNPIKVSYAE